MSLRSWKRPGGNFLRDLEILHSLSSRVDTGYATATTDISARHGDNDSNLSRASEFISTTNLPDNSDRTFTTNTNMPFQILSSLLHHAACQETANKGNAESRGYKIRSQFIGRADKNARCHASCIQGQRFLELHLGFFLFVACPLSGAGSRAAKPVWCCSPHPYACAPITLSIYFFASL